MDVIYRAETNVVGGRGGRACSSDGVLDVDLASPGSQTKKGTNPEQLFAAGYSACFLSAVEYHAKQQGLSPDSASIDAAVDLGTHSEGDFGIQAELRVKLEGIPEEKAVELVRKAHETCPYSKATRGNIDVKLYANDAAVT
jgi:osmotically inducible protein OsmC